MKRQTGRETSYNEWECPPAVDNGLFFVVDSDNAGLVTASIGKLSMKLWKNWVSYQYGTENIQSVRMCFHRDDEVCKITFHLVTTKSQTVKFDTSIADHGLPVTGGYQPMLFLRESGTMTITELAS